MDEIDLPQTLEELSDLLGQRLGIRGATFAARVKRAGRLLPRKVRQASQALLEQMSLWENPKLRRQIDMDALAKNAKTVRTHLESIDRADRRKAYWLGVLTPLAFNLVLLFVGGILLASYLNG